MYALQKEQQEGKRKSLPMGEEFESLLTKLSSDKVDERIKIAMAAKYFSADREEEYRRIEELITPRTPEEITLKNNQDILVSLVKYAKEKQIHYLIKAKELIAKTHITPAVKTMFLLATEAPEEEILRESYKLDRNCKHAAKLKVISFINAKKYTEALAVIDRVPVSLERTVLNFVISALQDSPEKEKLYNDLIKEIKDKLAKYQDIPETEIKEKSKEIEDAKGILNMYKDYVDRLMNKGPGIGLDAIISEIDTELKKSTGVALGSASQLVEKTTSNTEEALKTMEVSKKLFLEVEILRAETLLRKKRYIEAKDLAQALKTGHSDRMYESARERVALILISASLNQNILKDLDIPWIVYALSPREQRRKDIGLSDLIDLIKHKDLGRSSISHASLEWTQKMIDLSENTNLIWRPKIEKSKYYNRLGNIYFTMREIDKARDAYQQALDTESESQKKDISENIKVLNEWIERKDIPIKTSPESICLFKALGNKTENPSASDYVSAVMLKDTLPETADMLEEIATALVNKKSKEDEERIINILSLCSLVKFRKQILTPQEIADSNIAVIYNHILFWSKENHELDTSTVHSAIKYYTSKYSTEAQALVAKHAVILALKHLAKSGRVKIFNQVFSKVKDFIEKEKDFDEIIELKQELEKINTPLYEDKKEEKQEEKQDKKTESKKVPQISPENTASLLTKREEVMRMLTEKPEKKTSKKRKEEPEKRKKRKDLENDKDKKRKDPPKEQPVLIKKASHTVLSSEEEE